MPRRKARDASKRKVELKPPSVHPKNKLNALTGNEWLFFTKSVLRTSYPHGLGHRLRREQGGNKPPQLMQHLIEFFTKPGQSVLDPFAGVGGTLLGASLAGRTAAGIELNPRWVEIYRQVCETEGIEPQETLVGDCLEVLPGLAASGRTFDFIATDPPYSIALEKTMCDGTYDIQHRKTDFDKYSDDAADFRNLATFAEFYDAIERAFALTFPLLREGGYLAVIIRDSYQGGRYIPATYEIAQRIERGGYVMKGIKVWYATGARVRPYGYPNAYIPNIVHQNIAIFRKEKPAKAKRKIARETHGKKTGSPAGS
ncbi:MAG TPA: DNA methyltransferase [Planctomycetota bacterium]|nr:DNA methyltransferase [Planctomycetota bacterium]HRR79812.1 DNA methyltransferase [Planctomycetota bacterium]HRT96133.1 DNA methyltransferase [Planctomycetota bacterium]